MKIKARITIRPVPHTVMGELTFVPPELLNATTVAPATRCAHLVSELIELGITRDQEVVAMLRDVPVGTDVRKRAGDYGWLRADDLYARRVGAVSSSQILMIADGYRVSLWDRDLHVVVMLRDLIGEFAMSALECANEDK